MAQWTIWWVLTGIVIALELVTGTFYLLMLSIGLAAAAVAAHLGATSTVQMVVAAVVGGGAIIVWRSYKLRQPAAPPASANRDVNLDIGETVNVENWRSDGTSSVHYRGAKWAVSLAPGATATSGQHRIVEVVGSQLIVSKL